MGHQGYALEPQGRRRVTDREATIGRGMTPMVGSLVRAAPTEPREPTGQVGKHVYMVDEIGVPYTEECRARLTERSEKAPEHEEEAKVADEKRRDLLCKRRACEIVNAETTSLGDYGYSSDESSSADYGYGSD